MYVIRKDKYILLTVRVLMEVFQNFVSEINFVLRFHKVNWLIQENVV